VSLITVYDEDFLPLPGGGAPRVPIFVAREPNGSSLYKEMTWHGSNGDHYVSCQGPFWKDANHLPFYLHLLCILYRDSAMMPPPISKPGTIPAAATNLVGGEFIVRCRAKGTQPQRPGFYLPKKARIGNWLQTYEDGADAGEGSFVNYFQSSDLMCEAHGVNSPYLRGGNDALMYEGPWQDVTVRLEGKHLAALGASALKDADYGTATHPDLPLENWTHNIGIIALMGHDPESYTYPVGFEGGQFQIDRITLRVDPLLNPNAVAV
jgi:hypothetical protein